MTGLVRRALQTAIAVFACVPLGAGVLGVARGTAAFYDGAGGIGLDSHVRYLSGLLFALGAAFVSCIPALETRTERFTMLTIIVFTGGLARLYALAVMGNPGAPMLFGLGMELVVTPLLCLAVRAFSAWPRSLV